MVEKMIKVTVTVRCKKCGLAMRRIFYISTDDREAVIRRARFIAQATAYNHFLSEHLPSSTPRDGDKILELWREFGGFYAFFAEADIPDLGISREQLLGEK